MQIATAGRVLLDIGGTIDRHPPPAALEARAGFGEDAAAVGGLSARLRPEPMRIAMYHFSLPQPGRKPGGVEVYVDRLATAMTSRGHEVEVLTYSAPPPGAGYRPRRLRPQASEHRRLLRQDGSPWLPNPQSLA